MVLPFDGVLPLFSEQGTAEEVLPPPSTATSFASAADAQLSESSAPIFSFGDQLPFDERDHDADIEMSPVRESKSLIHFISFRDILIIPDFIAHSLEDTKEVVQDLTRGSPMRGQDVIDLRGSSEDDGNDLDDIDDFEEETPPKKTIVKTDPSDTIRVSRGRKVRQFIGRPPVSKHSRVEQSISSVQVTTPRSARSDKKGKGKKRQASPLPIPKAAPTSRTRSATLVELQSKVPSIQPSDFKSIGQVATSDEQVSFLTLLYSFIVILLTQFTGYTDVHSLHHW